MGTDNFRSLAEILGSVLDELGIDNESEVHLVEPRKFAMQDCGGGAVSFARFFDSAECSEIANDVIGTDGRTEAATDNIYAFSARQGARAGRLVAAILSGSTKSQVLPSVIQSIAVNVVDEHIVGGRHYEARQVEGYLDAIRDLRPANTNPLHELAASVRLPFPTQ